MKRLYISLLIVLFTVISCKKDAVDATNTQTFQSSINDMASGLTTLKQVKFNEALYILKTFGVEGETESERLANLGRKINGLKVPQILSLADETAQKNGIDWTSTGPPSLGEMNIFGSVDEAKSFDPNDIKATSLSITTIEIMKDSVLGAKAIQVIPRLVDANNKPIEFSGAALETIMEVFSNGNKIYSSKNLMQDNDFKGFTVRISSLPAAKIVNNEIDITVTVKTTDKTLKMSKLGVAINPKVLVIPVLEEPTENEGTNEDNDFNENITSENPNASLNNKTKPVADPKQTVSRFLSQLNSQNLRGAYEVSENPNWGSYDSFSNPTSGFGAVKNVSVKNVSTKSVSENTASVNATYDVTSKDGKTTVLKVTFGLKNVNGDWKISSYKIN